MDERVYVDAMATEILLRDFAAELTSQGLEEGATAVQKMASIMAAAAGKPPEKLEV